MKRFYKKFLMGFFPLILAFLIFSCENEEIYYPVDSELNSNLKKTEIIEKKGFESQTYYYKEKYYSLYYKFDSDSNLIFDNTDCVFLRFRTPNPELTGHSVLT